MNFDAILATIDSEIAKLQQARALLTDTAVVAKKSVGRPKGSKVAPPAAPAPSKRILSAEARAKIAAAQKKRWAVAKKAK